MLNSILSETSGSSWVSRLSTEQTAKRTGVQHQATSLSRAARIAWCFLPGFGTRLPPAFIKLIYVYGHFVCIYICALCICLVPMEGIASPEIELQAVVNHQVGTGD